MARFRVQVFYQKGIGEKWSNVWGVEATDLSTAAAAASGDMVTDLLPLLSSACQIVRVLTSDPTTPGTFIEAAVGLAGTSSASGSLLPLFNSAKVLFPILSGGRPDYKFLKGFLSESITEDSVISSGTLSFIASQLETLITDMAGAGATLVDTDGNNYSVVTPQSNVQMRQMHRRRRRSTI